MNTTSNVQNRAQAAPAASCYNHQAARGDRLPLLPNRRRGLGTGGPFYWMPLSPSLSPLVPREAREKNTSGGCNKMRPTAPDYAPVPGSLWRVASLGRSPAARHASLFLSLLFLVLGTSCRVVQSSADLP